jgi:hypothetical protein
MRIQCDSCAKSVASVICCADEAALCADCDSRIHSANKLVSKHQRVPFLPDPDSPPRCDICQEKLAFFFCLEDRALLCCNCDLSIHNANALTGKHRRFLIPGTRVSLGAVPAVEDKCTTTEQPLTPEAEEAEAASYTYPAAKPSLSFSETLSPSLKSGERLRLPPSTCSSHKPNNSEGKTTTTITTGMMKPEAATLSRLSSSSFLPPASNNLITPRRFLQTSGGSAASCCITTTNTHTSSMPSAFHMEQQHQQSSGLMHCKSSSITEFLTDAIPGWQVEELLLNLPELTTTGGGYTICDGGGSTNKAEALSLEELDWMMPHCTLQGNQQVFVDAVREVPQLPPLPQTPVLPEPVMMPWLGRVVNSGSLKVKGNQEAILPVETFLDAFVVPDLGTQQQQSSQFLKRRRNF